MTDKIEIPRALAEKLLRLELRAIWVGGIKPHDELRALLAAPVVERQKLMTIPDRLDVDELEDYNTNIGDVSYQCGWNACIDKLKELNQ